MEDQEAPVPIETLEAALRGEQILRAELQDELRGQQQRLEQLQEQLESHRADIWSLDEVQQAIEAVTRSGSEFVIQMDRRLRTNLNGLIGMIELLVNSELSADGQEVVAGARSSGKELLGVLNGVLEYCRMDAGHTELQSAPLDTRALLEDCRALAREAVVGRPITVLIKRGEHVPTRILGDEEQLRRVLGNLITNAAQNTTQGHLTLGIEIAGQGQDAEVQLRVSDTGSGIAEEDLTRICEPFERTAGGEGLGLGLTEARRITQLMGAEFRLESELGKGSTATICFPFDVAVEEDEGSLSSAKDEPASERTTARVLVAEDNDVNQKVALGFLKMLGCEAEAAWNGLQALETLNAGQFDLLLMDCMMPELDGYGATQCIRSGQAGEAYSSMPIIALTADDSPGARQNCLRAGMDDYMTKPVSIDRLRAMLRTWLPPALRPPAE